MKRLLVLCAAALLMASAADAADREFGARSADPGVQYAAQYPAWRRGGHHGWGVVRHNAAWCRMFARADITPTAIGPESQRRIVLANPAPLDIDEPRAPIRRTPPTRNGRAALARESPAGAGKWFWVPRSSPRADRFDKQYRSGNLCRRGSRRWRLRRFRRRVSRFILGGGKMMHLRVAA